MHATSIWIRILLAWLQISILLVLNITPVHSIDCSNDNPKAVYNFESEHAQLVPHLHSQPYAFQRVNNIVRRGASAARFEVREDDVWRDAKYNRAEFSDERYFVQRKHLMWYAFSIYVPLEFLDINNRMVLIQWPSYPDKHLGEVWRSPIMAARYENGDLYFTVRYSEKKVQTENDGESREISRIHQLEKGRWHDFIVNLYWSYNSDGKVAIWHGDKLLTEYRGPVGYNDECGVFWKFGIYRDNHLTSQHVYFDELKRGLSRKDIAFPSVAVPIIELLLE